MGVWTSFFKHRWRNAHFSFWQGIERRGSYNPFDLTIKNPDNKKPEGHGRQFADGLHDLRDREDPALFMGETMNLENREEAEKGGENFERGEKRAGGLHDPA